MLARRFLMAFSIGNTRSDEIYFDSKGVRSLWVIGTKIKISWEYRWLIFCPNFWRTLGWTWKYSRFLFLSRSRQPVQRNKTDIPVSWQGSGIIGPLWPADIKLLLSAFSGNKARLTSDLDFISINRGLGRLEIPDKVYEHQPSHEIKFSDEPVLKIPEYFYETLPPGTDPRTDKSNIWGSISQNTWSWVERH